MEIKWATETCTELNTADRSDCHNIIFSCQLMNIAADLHNVF